GSSIILAVRARSARCNQLPQKLCLERIQLLFLGPAPQTLLILCDQGCRPVGDRLVFIRHFYSLAGFSGVEKSLQPVEVPLRNRVVLVIVAARAPHGEAEENRARGGSHLAEIVLPDIGRQQI